MKQKELSILLRAVVAVCAVLWLFWAYALVKSFGASLLEVYYGAGAHGVLVLILTAMLLLILGLIFLAMILAWQIFTDIGRGRSFTVKSARRLRAISHLALAGTLTSVVMGLARLGYQFSRIAEPYQGQQAGVPSLLLSSIDGQVLLFLLVAAVGAAVTIGAAALSHLTLKAADLQDESALTI